MEVEANPLQLSLDELIKLNKLRNQEAEREAFNASIPVNTRTKTIVMEDEDIISNENVLRDEPKGTGSRSVHDRLGYKKHTPSIYRKGTETDRVRALQGQKFNILKRPQGVLKNCRILTRNALLRQNKTRGNFSIRRGPVNNGFFRHSEQACLDPAIQRVLTEMRNNDNPAMVTHNVRGQIIDDHANLRKFIVHPDTTNITTHAQFEMNG